MSEEILTAKVRQSKGKRACRKLRYANQIPAMLYGSGQSVMLEMDEPLTRRFISHLSGTHRLVPLQVVDEDGGSIQHDVIIQEIQQHPYRRKLVHLDFRKLDAETPISLKVPMKIVGSAPGVKKGGIIQMIVREIPVSCLPANIPEFIEVDVSNLDFNETIRVNDIKPPESITIRGTQNYSVVTIIGRKAGAEVTETEEMSEVGTE